MLRNISSMILGVLLTFFLCLSPILAQDPNGYKVYISAATYPEGQQVQVIDSATNTIVGAPILTAPFVYNSKVLAITPDGAFIYLTSDIQGGISVISTATKKFVGTPIHPPHEFQVQGLAITPDGAFLYATYDALFDGSPNAVAVISTATNTIVGQPISLGPAAAQKFQSGSNASSISITPNGQFVYVLVTPSYVDTKLGERIVVISTATNTVVGQPIALDATPSGPLVITPDGAFVYFFIGGNLMTISTATNMLVGAPIPVLARAPADIAITPGGAYLYMWQDCNILVFSIASKTFVARMWIQNGVSCYGGGGPSAFTPDGAFLYTGGDLYDGSVWVISTASNTVTARIPVPYYNGQGKGGPMGIAISPQAAIPATCGCSKTGNYVNPDQGAVPGPGQYPVHSPGSKYRVSTSSSGAVRNLTVTQVSTGATVFSTSAPIDVNWGFSPDDDRFVYHYLQGTVDNVFVYDLTWQGSPNLAPIAVSTQQSRLQFSSSGRYFFYSALTGPSHTVLEIYQVAGVTAPTLVYQTEFDFQTVPGSGSTYGTVLWGFSPDKPESSFAYAYLNGANSVQWDVVSLPAGTLIHTETILSISSFWQFSPCGDLIGIVKQPSLNQVEFQLFQTSDGSVVPGSDQTFALVSPISFSSTLTTQIATVGTQQAILAANTQCPGSNTPTGSNVVARPHTGLTVTFATVTQPGTTIETSSGSGAAPPSNFRLGSPAAYFDVSTSASFTGMLTVCFNYTGFSFSSPAGPRLFHFEGGMWVDRTTSVNTANRIVCGSVSSLSPFALFESAVPGDVNGDGIVDCTDVAIVKASFGKSFQVGYNPAADVNGDGVVDIRDLALVARQLPAGTRCP